MISPSTPAPTAEDLANASVNSTPSTGDSRATPDNLVDLSSFFVDDEDDDVKAIRDELMNTIEEVKRINFSERPRLIKLISNKTLKTLTITVNTIIDELIPVETPILELNSITFGAALYIQRTIAPWFDEKRKKPKRGKKNAMPWKYKLQKKVDTLRRELSLLVKKEPHTKHTAMKIRRIHRKYKIQEGQLNAKIAEHQADIKGIAAAIRNKE